MPACLTISLTMVTKAVVVWRLAAWSRCGTSNCASPRTCRGTVTRASSESSEMSSMADARAGGREVTDDADGSGKKGDVVAQDDGNANFGDEMASKTN